MLLNLISIIHDALLRIIALTSSKSEDISKGQQLPLFSATGQHNTCHTYSGSTAAVREDTHTSRRNTNTGTSLIQVWELPGHSSIHHAVGTRRMIVSSIPTHDITRELHYGDEELMSYFYEVILDLVNKIVIHSHDQFHSCLCDASNTPREILKQESLILQDQFNTDKPSFSTR